MGVKKYLPVTPTIQDVLDGKGQVSNRELARMVEALAQTLKDSKQIAREDQVEVINAEIGG